MHFNPNFSCIVYPSKVRNVLNLSAACFSAFIVVLTISENSIFFLTFVCVLFLVMQLYSYTHSRTHFKIFKIDYLITSNVQFGTVSTNPVTFNIVKGVL